MRRSTSIDEMINSNGDGIDEDDDSNSSSNNSNMKRKERKRSTLTHTHSIHCVQRQQDYVCEMFIGTVETSKKERKVKMKQNESYRIELKRISRQLLLKESNNNAQRFMNVGLCAVVGPIEIRFAICSIWLVVVSFSKHFFVYVFSFRSFGRSFVHLFGVLKCLLDQREREKKQNQQPDLHSLATNAERSELGASTILNISIYLWWNLWILVFLLDEDDITCETALNSRADFKISIAKMESEDAL